MQIRKLLGALLVAAMTMPGMEGAHRGHKRPARSHSSSRKHHKRARGRGRAAHKRARQHSGTH